MEETFSTDELKLAFSYHIINQISGADGIIEPEEAKFLQRSFPGRMLVEARFVAGGRFTRRWQEALGEALLVLPALPVRERLALVETFFRAAIADDHLAWAEADVVRRAARLLSLSEAEYGALLDHLVTGEVTLETEEK